MLCWRRDSLAGTPSSNTGSLHRFYMHLGRTWEVGGGVQRCPESLLLQSPGLEPACTAFALTHGQVMVMPPPELLCTWSHSQ